MAQEDLLHSTKEQSWEQGCSEHREKQQGLAALLSPGIRLRRCSGCLPCDNGSQWELRYMWDGASLSPSPQWQRLGSYWILTSTRKSSSPNTSALCEELNYFPLLGQPGFQWKLRDTPHCPRNQDLSSDDGDLLNIFYLWPPPTPAPFGAFLGNTALRPPYASEQAQGLGAAASRV